MCLAIPGRIIDFSEEHHFATVDVSGVRRKVNVDLLRDEGVAKDDWVLIHVGFAMSKISEEEAQEQLDLLAMMGEADAALEEIEGYGFDEVGEDGRSNPSGAGPPPSDSTQPEAEDPTEKNGYR